MTKVLAIVGDAPNQVALISKLHKVRPIDHLVLIKKDNRPIRKKSMRQLFVSASVNLPFRKAWQDLLAHYGSQYELPKIEKVYASSANDQLVIDLLIEKKPNLVLVSGTDILRDMVINVAKSYGRIMNLHTGVSPYIKGGPNCTNWAIYLNRFDLIGNTIMWLDGGIDTGNIIATERTDISDKDTLSTMHQKVMEHAHDLYCRCYLAFLEGRALASVPQREIDEGRLFFTRHWTASARILALLNFYSTRRRITSLPSNEVILVPLEK
jgi:folate-dependent phosphoribosylglycinamide formyltransferase PurN